MVDSSSDGAPRRLQDGISQIQKVAAAELGFCGAPRCSRGTWIYIGGRSRSVEPRGAHVSGGRADPPRAPRLLLDVHSKSPRLCLFQKDRSQRFHSVWTPFDIPFLQYTEIGKKGIQTGPPVSRLVPKMI